MITPNINGVLMRDFENKKNKNNWFKSKIFKNIKNSAQKLKINDDNVCYFHEYKNKKNIKVKPEIKHEIYEEYDNKINDILDNKLFECECCFNVHVQTEKIICTEGHGFCKECLLHYSINKITSGQSKLNCMSIQGVCRGTFDNYLLQTILDPKLYERYCENELLENITTANIEDLYTCPKCCLYFVILDKCYVKNLKEPQFSCENPSCKYISCIKCKKNFHGTSDCNYANQDKKTRQHIEEILTNHRIRLCSICNKEIVRTKGCNKIECCGKFFCYRCKQIIHDYTHFNNTCEMFTSENEIENMSFQNAVQEIYDIYKLDEIKIINEIYPVLCTLKPDKIDIINKIFEIHLKNIKPVSNNNKNVYTEIIIAGAECCVIL